MLNGNGHSNGYGHGFTEDGKPKILPTSDGHHDREDIKMLVRSVTSKQLGEPCDLAWVYEVCKSIAQDENADKRARVSAAIGAASVAQKAVELGVRIMEFEDKTDRLDKGNPTERVAVYEVHMPAARDRITE